jgi:glyoxylase-like metal-dependent hydrolase (beta-lactamase superfamily II)
MQIQAFFDLPSKTYSYVVADTELKKCAVIDPVLEYTSAIGRTGTDGADKIIGYIQEQGFDLEWILETHVHADHLSSASYIKRQLGAKVAIGDAINTVQKTFGKLFNAGPEFAKDGSQFDCLFGDNEVFSIGSLQVRVMHTPGHTPACLSYLINDAVFVGDTLFMPDYGTARCDFPGGDAKALYQSIQRLFSLNETTRVFVCHDYLPQGRTDYRYESSIAEQKQHNIHIHTGITEQSFIDMRNRRDATLNKPELLLPSVQINMRAGDMPEPEDNGISYLKIPMNRL